MKPATFTESSGVGCQVSATEVDLLDESPSWIGFSFTAANLQHQPILG